MTNQVHAYKFLEEAVTQMKDRAVQRDKESGERSMASTVAAFNALTGHNLTEAEGWEFMVLLKLVRGRQGKFRDDDYVDAAAYAGLLGECRSANQVSSQEISAKTIHKTQQPGLSFPPNANATSKTAEDFVEKFIGINPRNKIPFLTLYDSYAVWCTDNGVFIQSINSFHSALCKVIGVSNSRVEDRTEVWAVECTLFMKESGR